MNPIHALLSILLCFCFFPSHLVSQSSSLLCLPLFSANTSSVSDLCPPGFWCPHLLKDDPTTFPVICSPSAECSNLRSTQKMCPPQGPYEIVVCSEGFYCPMVSDSNPPPNAMIQCPSGYYCPYGTTSPYTCGPFAYCPAQSSNQRDYSGLFIIVIVDSFLVVLLLLYLRHQGRQQKARRQRLETQARAVAKEAAAALDAILGSPASKSRSAMSLTRTYSERRSILLAEQTADIAFKKLAAAFLRTKQHSGLPGLAIKFEDFSLSIPASRAAPAKVLLKGINGYVNPGSVTAILGPSGSGKTTFLSTMMGKVDSSWPRSGRLEINGRVAEISAYKQFVGYCPQDDVTRRELTVYQNLMYSASMRLPPDWTKEDREQLVETVMDALGLTGVRDEVIGNLGADVGDTRGLSLETRKRINIALELVAAPVAIFLDEPTTSMDAYWALRLCILLRRLARVCQITVCMIIHQPRAEIFNSLDDLLLLCPGGKTVYQGPQALAAAYFHSHPELQLSFQKEENVADLLMDAIARVGDKAATVWSTDGPAHLKGMQQKLEKEEQEEKLEDMEKEKEKQVEKSVEEVDVAAAMAAEKEEKKLQEFRTELLKEHNIVDATTDKGTSTLPSRGASFPLQVWLACERSLLQQFSSLSTLLWELSVSVVVGIIFGLGMNNNYLGAIINPFVLLSPSGNEFIPLQSGMFLSWLAGLSSAVPAVSLFVGDEQNAYWRGAASGESRLAYYLGVNIAATPRIVLSSLHGVAFFYLAAAPVYSFGALYILMVLGYWAAYGVAACLVMLISRGNAALVTEVFVVITGIFNGYVQVIPPVVQYLVYPRWLTEGLFTLMTEPFAGIMQVSAQSASIWDFTYNAFGRDLALLVLVGAVYRLLGFLLMIGRYREKQR